MPSITVDDDVFSFLQKEATAFIDTPNSVLRRLLKIESVPTEVKSLDSEATMGAQHYDDSEITEFLAELNAELINKAATSKWRAKQPKTDLEKLIHIGALQQGETVYLVDYQESRIPGYEAKIQRGRLEFEGQTYSMSDLARRLLNRVGFASTSVRGPAHWANAKGQTLALLWDDYLSNQ